MGRPAEQGRPIQKPGVYSNASKSLQTLLVRFWMLSKEVNVILYKLRPLRGTRSERVGNNHRREALEMLNSSSPKKLVEPQDTQAG